MEANNDDMTVGTGMSSEAEIDSQAALMVSSLDSNCLRGPAASLKLFVTMIETYVTKCMVERKIPNNLKGVQGY